MARRRSGLELVRLDFTFDLSFLNLGCILSLLIINHWNQNSFWDKERQAGWTKGNNGGK